MQDIVEFIFFPVINEGCRVVEERIVDKPSDLDVAAVLGMGFPPYRGGLIKFADLVGAKHIVDRLQVRDGGSSMLVACLSACTTFPLTKLLACSQLASFSLCMAAPHWERPVVQAWEQQFSSAGLGGFFRPCKYLADRAASGQQLSAGLESSSRL